MDRNLRRWPTLYKKSSTGKWSVWKIWVEGSTIHTDSGFEGQKMKSSKDTIYEGKNTGRSNATDKYQQAESEAASKFQRYLDKGYSESKKGSKITKNVVFPMLAHEYEKHAAKMPFPCFVQPKLDGGRAIFKDGKFWSRNGKPLASPPDLVKEVRAIFGDYIVDGEFYNHEAKDDFESLMSAAKTIKGKNSKESLLQYHVYDMVGPVPFRERRNIILRLFENFGRRSSLVHRVKTIHVGNKELLEELHESFLEQGYEGSMIRNPLVEYEAGRRSYSLLKYKTVDDSEFRIVGIKPGRGQLQGCVGAFILEVDDEKGKRTFDCKMTGKGVNKFLKEALENPKIWKGKWMQVHHMGWTNKNNVPRHPRGIKIREVV